MATNRASRRLQAREAESKRKMPIRSRTITLDGDYAGWWIKVRTNVPAGRWRDAYAPMKELIDMDEEEIRLDQHWMAKYNDAAAMLLAACLLDWNFVDEEGEDIPARPDSIDLLPNELTMAVMAQMGGAPSAPLETSSNSESGSTPEPDSSPGSS